MTKNKAILISYLAMLGSLFMMVINIHVGYIVLELSFIAFIIILGGTG